MVSRDLRAMDICHAVVLEDDLVGADRWPKDEALRSAPCNWPSVQAGPDHDKLEIDGSSDGVGLNWHNSVNTLGTTGGVPIRRVLSGIAPAHFLRYRVFNDIWELAVAKGPFLKFYFESIAGGTDGLQR